MENFMIHDLEDILNNVQKLKNQYHKICQNKFIVTKI